MRMRVIRRKNGRLYVWPSKGGSARSWQRSSFRENATNVLTFVACWVWGCVFTTNRSPGGEMWLNGQTDTQTDTVTLAAHARRGLTIVCFSKYLKHTSKYVCETSHTPRCWRGLLCTHASKFFFLTMYVFFKQYMLRVNSSTLHHHTLQWENISAHNGRVLVHNKLFALVLALSRPCWHFNEMFVEP